MQVKTPVSTSRLKSRRQELKNQRRWRDFVSSIRTLSIMGITGGVFWFLTLPNWVINHSKQIQVQGNDLLSEEEIRSLIPLQYPQPLLQLSIEELKEELQKKIPLRNVSVTRQLLPPQLTIRISEKKPVAIAFARQVSPKTKKVELTKVGYIDEDGVFVPKEFYQNLAKKPDLQPSLKVFGVPYSYLVYWRDFYSLLNQSNVKILEVDWQNPANIILTTEIGKVYFGPYTSKFPKQLMLLEKLKNITSKVPKERIIYIDLTDPEMPSLKEKQPPKEDKKKTEQN